MWCQRIVFVCLQVSPHLGSAASCLHFRWPKIFGLIWQPQMNVSKGIRIWCHSSQSLISYNCIRQWNSWVVRFFFVFRRANTLSHFWCTRLITKWSELYQSYQIVLVIWTLVTICSALLMFQMEVGRFHFTTNNCFFYLICCIQRSNRWSSNAFFSF